MKNIVKEFNFWMAILCFIIVFLNLFIFENKYLIITILFLIIGVVDMFNAIMTVKINKDDK